MAASLTFSPSYTTPGDTILSQCRSSTSPKLSTAPDRYRRMSSHQRTRPTAWGLLRRAWDFSMFLQRRKHGVRGSVTRCPVGMNGVRNRVMNATRLSWGAAVIVCLSATARAESPPAWQAPDFVMEEIVVTAPPSAPLYTEEIVVTARVAARPGGEANTVRAGGRDDARCHRAAATVLGG